MSNEYKDWLADTDAEIAYKMLHEEPLTEQEALRMARQEMCTEMFCVVEDRIVKRHRNDIYKELIVELVHNKGTYFSLHYWEYGHDIVADEQYAEQVYPHERIVEMKIVEWY